MSKLFGTDGPRGIAVTDLTCELAMQTGRAVAVVLGNNSGKRRRVIVGKDTRISSDPLEAAVFSGICSVGADPVLLGVVPVPAVPYMIAEYEADAGIMISGSHNSAEFNGLKVFDSHGRKLSDDIEEKIEHLVLDEPQQIKLASHDSVGRIINVDNAAEKYISHVQSLVDADLDGMKIAVDCANGCASDTAGLLFASMGAEVFTIASDPDGTNINKNCGTNDMEKLIKFTAENDCDCGFAFDGDADRCLAVDENGQVIDGDRLIAVFAEYMKREGTLKQDTAVVTMMSNMGLDKYAEEHGINLVTAGAGHRYVLERMLEGGYNLGGEPSGHIIFLDDATIGDGQLAAARLMKIMRSEGKKLSELAADMVKLPQVMVNVDIDPQFKELWKNDREVSELIHEISDTLGNDGRLVVRESGTEPKIRIMAEGEDFAAINDMTLKLSEILKEKFRTHKNSADEPDKEN